MSTSSFPPDPLPPPSGETTASDSGHTNPGRRGAFLYAVMAIIFCGLVVGLAVVAQALARNSTELQNLKVLTNEQREQFEECKDKDPEKSPECREPVAPSQDPEAPQQGPIGPIGQPGVGVASVICQQNGVWLILYTDGRREETGSCVGREGQRGVIGPSGEPGPVGPPGSVGPQGPPGSLGPQGQPGESGQPGQPGESGQPGQPGESGQPGQPGESGQPGQPGESGQPGAPGEPGATGPAGPPGDQGPKGDQGDPGAKGDVGAPGRSVTEAECVDGTWIIRYDQAPLEEEKGSCTTGTQGEQGPAGPEGPEGPQGPAGDDGENGQDGRGIVSMECQENGRWRIEYDQPPLVDEDAGQCRGADGEDGGILDLGEGG